MWNVRLRALIREFMNGKDEENTEEEKNGYVVFK
jgi:hypothetical protein